MGDQGLRRVGKHELAHSCAVCTLIWLMPAFFDLGLGVLVQVTFKLLGLGDPPN